MDKDLKEIIEKVKWTKSGWKWTYFLRGNEKVRRVGVFKTTQELCAEHILKKYGSDWEEYVDCYLV